MANHTPWGGSDRAARLPKDWPSRRRRVLARDGYRCRKCGGHASEVDHIIPDDDHSLPNLQSLCTPCHKAKTSAEAAAARTRYQRRRPVEQHPGMVPEGGGGPL